MFKEPAKSLPGPAEAVGPAVPRPDQMQGVPLDLSSS